MKKILISIILLLSCITAYGKDKVEEIMKKGVIRSEQQEIINHLLISMEINMKGMTLK